MALSQLNKVILIYLLLIVGGRAYAQKTNSGNSETAQLQITKGGKITLHGYSENAVAYQWYKDSTKIEGAINKDYVAELAGKFSVIAYNNEGCPSPMSDNLTVIIKSTDSIAMQQDTTVDLAISIASTNIKAIPGESFRYIVNAKNNSNVTGTGVKVTVWLSTLTLYVPNEVADTAIQFDHANNTVTWTIGTFGNYASKSLNLNVTTLKPGSVETNVKIKGNQTDILPDNNIALAVQQVSPLAIPNVFTPNGDGVNDTFTIPGLDAYMKSELMILNKAGNLVYNKNDYQNTWSGDGLAEGTYFYVLKVETGGGDWNTYKGYLTLLRSKLN